ncbi:hypothetical protein [Brachyspira sp.]|uniref:hypothetical protein n=1 Tax=Brachyspira sp. TaxID=1977261 RepID=UPI00263065D5|nr:hypothetical protein [Brachyspira sp.]
MKKPIPYKKPEEKKQLNKKKLFMLIILEIIIILLSIVTTAIISLLFGINPYISAGISAAILVVFSVFVAREFLISMNSK